MFHHLVVRSLELSRFRRTVALVVLAMSGLSAAIAETPGLTRGPYLQRVAPDRIVVRWRTDVATDRPFGR